MRQKSPQNPLMLVAEAVRRSMSIPIAFEPRDGLIVDGGLYSNFPAWTLSSAFDHLWPSGTPDPQRPKVGFALNESEAPPRSWKLSKAKFRVEGEPPSVDFKDVLQGVLLALAGRPGFPPVSSDLDVLLEQIPVQLLEVISATTQAKQSSQDVMRAQLAEAVFSGSPYYDIPIPLLGFHWLDFAINLAEGDLDAIRQRGWYAAQEALGRPRPELPPILTDRARTRPNPYLGIQEELPHRVSEAPYIEDRLSALEADVAEIRTLLEAGTGSQPATPDPVGQDADPGKADPSPVEPPDAWDAEPPVPARP